MIKGSRRGKIIKVGFANTAQINPIRTAPYQNLFPVFLKFVYARTELRANNVESKSFLPIIQTTAST